MDVLRRCEASLNSKNATPRTLKLHAGATCVRADHGLLCVLLLGESGAGKTTIVRLSSKYGMIPLADDAVRLDSEFNVFPADDPPVYNPNRRGKLKGIYILNRRDIDPELALFFGIININGASFWSWKTFHDLIFYLKHDLRILRTDKLSPSESITKISSDMGW